MAIQIRELIVRASVDIDKKDVVGSNTKPYQPLGQQEIYTLKKQILEECMEKVEKLLNRRNRR